MTVQKDLAVPARAVAAASAGQSPSTPAGVATSPSSAAPAGFTGDLIRRGGPEYDSARRVFNGLIDKRPDVILRPSSVADIVRAVRYSVEHATEIAVRGGGHSVAGHSTSEGGAVIDLSRLRAVKVDLRRQVASVGPGALWRDVDRATGRHGLATPGGVVSSTGVGGFSLGGGVGWLSRRYGLTCDNLLAADLILASGEMLRVSERENADVLWALRGGGGNFGVVSRFELALHPVRRVLGGIAAYEGSDAKIVLRHYRKVMGDAGDELAAILDFAPLSEQDPRPLVTILACSTRTDDAAADTLRRLLTVEGATRPPVALIQRAFRYPSWQRIVDHTAPAGRMNYWKSAFLTELSDDAAEELGLLGLTLPSPWSRLHLIRLGGQPSRRAPSATAFASRLHPYIVHLITAWTDPAQTVKCTAWTNHAFDLLRPLAPAGAYLNFIGDEGHDRVRESFGEQTYARLAGIKAQLDPENRFCLNQNILPGTAGRSAGASAGDESINARAGIAT